MVLKKIHRHVVRRVGCFGKTLAPRQAAPAALPAGLAVRELDANADIQALAHLNDTVPEALLQKRFDLGYRCFATLKSDQVVHSMWVAFRFAHVLHLKRDIIIPEGSAYAFDSWTDPHYRRQGLSKLRSRFMERTMCSAGVRNMLGLVVLDNVAGMAAMRAAGYATMGHYLGVALGPWVMVSAHPESGQQLPVLRAPQ
jgi:hypothetical protein